MRRLLDVRYRLGGQAMSEQERAAWIIREAQRLKREQGCSWSKAMETAAEAIKQEKRHDASR